MLLILPSAGKPIIQEQEKKADTRKQHPATGNRHTKIGSRTPQRRTPLTTAILHKHTTVQTHTRLYYTISTYTILHYTTLHYTILYYTILYYTILYYTIVYYIIIYYIILYYSIIYYTILYCTIIYYTVL